MHRDHKLGLALGVLVIGFAAALCFPKQSDIDQRLLQLENAAELDADIAQLPVHAYTNADPRPIPIPEATIELGPEATVPGDAGESELLAGPPAPISPPVATDSAAAAALDQEPPLRTTSDHDPGAQVKARAADVRHYTVRPGDTLSSLAALFLGSHVRYLELFEANREILATPDDLRPGMVLNVPTADRIIGGELKEAEEILARPAESLPNDVADQHAPAETTATVEHAVPATNGRRLFRPAGSAPFLKAQPVSRGSAVPLPPMDTSANQTDGQTTPDESASVRTYTVRPGDTLEGIAVKNYGDARSVRRLMDANRNTVRDPRRLKPGMILTLPE